MDDIRTNPTLNEKVIDGRLRNLAPDRPVVAIGVRLAEALGATVGSSISLISPQGQVTPFGTAPRIVSYEVGAIFEVGVYDYDKAFAIMPTEQAQTLLMLGDAVGMIAVMTTDADNVRQILAHLADQVPGRPEERGGGKECVRPCRSRRWTLH